MVDNQQDQVEDVDVEGDDPPVDLENPETAESNDEEDVAAALAKDDTDDGKGGAVVPGPDFQSFAGDNVEGEPDEDEKDSV